MKRLFVLFLIISTAISLSAQVEIEWQRCLGGTGNDGANSIQQTTNVGYIVAGNSHSNDGDISGNHGGGDIWVIKIDHQGNIQWQKCLGGTGDEGGSIQQTNDGGYIAAGTTNSNDGDVSGNKGGNDGWLVKLDSTGNITWQKCLGGSGGEQSHTIAKTNDGGCIVSGWSGSDDGDVGGNYGTNDVWVVNWDYWVMKLDSSGNITWKKCLGGTGQDQGYCVAKTSDGGCLVGGYCLSNNGQVSGNNGGGDIWLAKLDSSGSLSWQKCLGGTNAENVASIQQTSDGGYVLAGYAFSNNGDVSGNHGGQDYWVVKLAP